MVDYYGHQDIDFTELRARVLCHFAEHDPLVGGEPRARWSSSRT